ncbi:ubiquitin-related modifier 1-like (URM1) [Vairimorpha necatrix]|uniref:Ubiquitin-related modifier 1 n=1 Tax=Vairimorpha necatrix TaxID=6039 RepID=A0AAX4JG23_9MICR
MIVRFSGSADPSLNDKDYNIETENNIKSIFLKIYSDITTEYTNNDGTIKDGVLCLLDDSDWELSGCYDSDLSGLSFITLINTIHGG